MKKMMKIKIYKVPVLFFLLLAGWQSVFSQSHADSLMTYLELAARNNPGVMQKLTEYKAALQKVPQAGSLPDPELSLGVFLKPMELMEGYQEADIRLMQMFPWFGVLRNAKDEMSLMAKAKFESFREAKLSLFYDLQRTWYELIKTNQEINILQTNIEILKTIEQLTMVRFKSPFASGGDSGSGGVSPAGTSPVTSSGSSGMQNMGGAASNTAVSVSKQGYSSMSSNSMGSSAGGSGLVDLYRIQIESADLENNLESLKNTLSTITARFNAYLNRPVASAISIPDTLIPDVLHVALTAVTDSILTGNPMLAMLKYEQQSLDARYKMIAGMGYPMIGVGINYTVIKKLPAYSSPMNGKDMVMPMVTVTLPIYRKKYNAMKSEAELMKTATSQGYIATSNSLKTEFYQAVELYNDSKRREKLYNDQSQLADKSLNIMLKSFSSSGAGLTDVLRVRQQSLDYKFKKAEATADFNTAIAWLKKLMAFYKI
jgi:outer membrane protein TolC